MSGLSERSRRTASHRAWRRSSMRPAPWAGGRGRGHRMARRTVRHQRARDPLAEDDRGDVRTAGGFPVSWSGRSGGRDVALVRAPGAAMASVRTADPSALRPGSLVMAIGHPFGLVDAVSTGVLQSVGELPFGFDFEGRTLRWVQADVRLGPGNSGGPLADADGRVIGVAAMIVAGMALAVPAPEVEALLASSG